MGKSKGEISSNVSVRNKQAKFNYELQDSFMAGIVLEGTEIKSIRQGKVSFADGYCYFSNGELYVKGIHISPYLQASFKNHDPDRARKLLLKKTELKKLEKKVNEKGLTIVPTKLFINSRGFAKLEIALAKGKKIFDKRESLKAKDQQREIDKFS